MISQPCNPVEIILIFWFGALKIFLLLSMLLTNLILNIVVEKQK